MIQGIIFDLDDTIYDSSQFYLGAFHEMVGHLTNRVQVGPDRLYSSLLKSWRELTSRRHEFLPAFLLRENLPAEEKPALLEILWHHEAPLQIYPDAARLLNRVPEQFRAALVTDGHGIMQRSKVRALDLVGRFDPIVFASDFGPGWRKPCSNPGFWHDYFFMRVILWALSR